MYIVYKNGEPFTILTNENTYQWWKYYIQQLQSQSQSTYTLSQNINNDILENTNIIQIKEKKRNRQRPLKRQRH